MELLAALLCGQQNAGINNKREVSGSTKARSLYMQGVASLILLDKQITNIGEAGVQDQNPSTCTVLCF